MLFTSGECGRLKALGVENVSLRLGRVERFASHNAILGIIGHSATGKSALLESVGIDRTKNDMDAFCSLNRLPHSLATFNTMCRSIIAKGPVIACSNDPKFLDEICERSNELSENVVFVYIKRPANTVYEHRKYKNTDGQFHAPLARDAYTKVYDAANAYYERLADLTIGYVGDSVANLSKIIYMVAAKLGVSLRDPNLRSQRKRRPRDATSTLAAPKEPSLTHLLWDDSSNTNGAGFNEYLAVIEEYRKQPDSVLPIDAVGMKALTAGGYQVFDTKAFPPTVDQGSLSFKKLGDLKWQRDEFTGKTVLDLGCLLGFFTFQALHLGAKQCVGMDATPRSVLEANKIAVNYKMNVCHWPEDRIRFVNKTIVPRRSLHLFPDVIVANSILHWWFIQDKEIHLKDILIWLRDSCGYGVYFEGCVSAEEEIMKTSGVATSRLTEEMFLDCAAEVFNSVTFVGRCSYNNQRIVVRMLK